MIYNGLDDFKIGVAKDKHEIFLNIIKCSRSGREVEEKKVILNIKF